MVEREKEARLAMTLPRAKQIFEGQAGRSTRMADFTDQEAAIDFIADLLSECGVLSSCRFKIVGTPNSEGWQVAVDTGSKDDVVRALRGSRVEWLIPLLAEIPRPTCNPESRVVMRDPMDVLGDITKE